MNDTQLNMKNIKVWFEKLSIGKQYAYGMLLLLIVTLIFDYLIYLSIINQWIFSL